MVWKLINDLADHLIPWQKRIKDIESHFGSVVSSYFVFLRWIFWMNFAITIVLTVAVIIPEVRNACQLNQQLSKIGLILLPHIFVLFDGFK